MRQSLAATEHGAVSEKMPLPIASDDVTFSTSNLFEPQGCGFLACFAEEDIDTPNSDNRHAAPIISQLLRFPSPQDRMEFVRQRIIQLGFDSLGYLAVSSSAHQKTMFALTSYESRTWLLRYFRERYFDFDPRVTGASPTGLPFIWSVSEMRAGLTPSKTRNERLTGLIDKLEEVGRRSGIVIRMPLPHPDMSACLFFNSEIDSQRWMTETLVAETLMFAHMMHEFIWLQAKTAIGIQVAPKSRGIQLSKMQFVILEAVVQGRPDKEIAYILGLSSHTVDYHLRRLRQLFNVRNRMQLINIARTQLE